MTLAKGSAFCVFLAILSAAVALISLRTGAVPISWREMVGGGDSVGSMVFQTMRVPRLLLGFLCGGALGLCGAAMQGLFRNPLADPALVGVSGGAALGAVAAIVLGGPFLSHSIYILPAAAFFGALAAAILVHVIATRGVRVDVPTLLLAGIAINAFAGAGIGWMIYGATDSQLRDFTFWSLGSLAGAGWDATLGCLPFVVVAAGLLAFRARALNALALGESNAWHLGVSIEGVKHAVLAATAFAVGAVTAFTGTIGFIGLVAPHLVRLAVGADHRLVLPGSFIVGGCLICAADVIARTARAPAEIPVGIVVASLGAPFFLGLLLREKRARA